jgi:hypothetical protein
MGRNGMTSELAEALRAAGFPGKGGRLEGVSARHDGNYTSALPSLEELIEACGITIDLDFSLKCCDGKWSCGVYGSTRATGHGRTPQQALARLWLALKAKG